MELDLSDIARDPFLGPQLRRVAGAGGGPVLQSSLQPSLQPSLAPGAMPSNPLAAINLVGARADAPGTMPAILHPEWYAMARMLEMNVSLLPFRTIDLNPTDDMATNQELARDMVGLLGVEDMPKMDHPGDRLLSLRIVPDSDDPLRRPHVRQAVWQHHGCDAVPKIDDPVQKISAPAPKPVIADTLEYDMN